MASIWSEDSGIIGWKEGINLEALDGRVKNERCDYRLPFCKGGSNW